MAIKSLAGLVSKYEYSGRPSLKHSINGNTPYGFIWSGLSRSLCILPLLSNINVFSASQYTLSSGVSSNTDAFIARGYVIDVGRKGSSPNCASKSIIRS